MKKAGWTPIGRDFVLDVLRPARGESDILDEFLDHLEQIEGDVQSYVTLQWTEWKLLVPGHRHHLVWSGLFQQLANKRAVGWGYVPNRTGGFMGLWWSFIAVPGGRVYLQLENERLVVKVGVEESGEPKLLRDTWVGRVISMEGPVRFERPRRLGRGQSMTVGEAPLGYLRTGADGRLDLPATLAVLDAATDSLRSLVEAHEHHPQKGG